MVKKQGLLIGVMLVVLAAPVAYWLISPLFRTTEVREDFSEILEMAGVAEPIQSETELATSPEPGTAPRERAPEPRVESKQGTFVGLAGHNGEGSASLVSVNGKYFVRLEDDFRVTNGPDLYVGFGKDGDYVAAGEIAQLKGNVGSQNYEVPASIDVSAYNEVWIWCRAFSVPFAKASLQ